MNRRYFIIVTAVLVGAVAIWWSLACAVDRGRVVRPLPGKDPAAEGGGVLPGDDRDGGRRSSRVKERREERSLAVLRRGGVELKVSRAGGVQVALEPDGSHLFRKVRRDSAWSQRGIWIRWRMKDGGELPGEPLVNAGWYNPMIYSSAIELSAANSFVRLRDPDVESAPLRPGEAVTRTTVAKLTDGYDRYRSGKMPKLDQMEFQIRIVPSEMGLTTGDGKMGGKDALEDLETEWIGGDEVRAAE